MTNKNDGNVSENLRLLSYGIDARHVRILSLILLAVLAATGCGGDDGGGGY